jgi:Domain of unknown function (DUF4226)
MTRPDDVVGADHQEGDAADAIRNAEVALARQNSTTAQVDLQVVTAVLNAHQKAAVGREALARLQRDIEGAVTTRSDLDTPAGARDFQRFLIGKLRDIRAVIAGASLDDTSNSALMAAWTSLYNAGEPGDGEAGDKPPPAAAPGQPVAQTRAAATEPGVDPYLDDDLGQPFDDPAPPVTSSPAPTAAELPSMPTFGGGGFPGGATPPGLGVPAGYPLPGPLSGGDASPKELDDALTEGADPEDRRPSDEDGHEDTESAAPRPARSGPTTATLPNGETLTAASPQLAAAIEAAAAGTPIAEAFQHEGITLPPPGTAVPDPVDPTQLAPGDIGMFTDRHALALGESRALVNGQIQHISTVTGPSFLGWEHPPVPVSAADKTDPPAPTRPAVADRTETA